MPLARPATTMHHAQRRMAGAANIIRAAAAALIVSAAMARCENGRYKPPSHDLCFGCPPGRYGDSPLLVNGSCSGPCDPGHWCEDGSATPRQHACGAGFYCPSGARSATEYPCPLGRFGASSKLATSHCDGLCDSDPGTFCAAGSDNEAATPCPPGSFCPGGALGAEQLVPCAAGRYGASSSLSSAECDGGCEAGYLCATGTADPRSRPCP